MTTLRITDAATTRAQVLVVGVTDQDGLQVVSESLSADSVSAIAGDLTRVGCDAEAGAIWHIPAPGSIDADSVIAVGIAAQASPVELREAAGAGVRAAAKSKTVVVALPNGTRETLAAVCEGALLGAHAPLRIGTGPSTSPGTVTVATAAPRNVRTAVRKEVLAAVDATILVRDLVNEPPGRLTPMDLAATARGQLKGLPVKVSVWDVPKLTKEGMGGILGVGQGSANPPRLIALEYAPKNATQHLAFVGKGITFDSGGLSLKPAKAMETMKCDMGGAAAVLAATKAIASLGLPVRISAYLACAENMPSGTAQRPGDVLTIRDGTTVEVVNTDAEGRLVMADALVLAAEQEPDAIIDVATLTGAQIVALGTRIAGVMGNDETLTTRVTEAGAVVGERFWPMPLPASLRSAMKSPVADMKNMGEPVGGMLFAGLFLQTFVPDEIPWAHLDIAGPAFNDGAAHGFTPPGGTGFAARTLVELARSANK